MPLDPAKILARRLALGLSQTAAAAAAGMDRANWARIESGDRTDPKLTTAERVAASLQTEIKKLLAD